jgi:ACR3 family arsenite efflux pump ArsB
LLGDGKAVTSEEHTKKELSLGLWEKYLTLWIAICIVVGLLAGRFLPEFGQFMESLKFAQLSIPIGILLFFMMYPTVVGMQFSARDVEIDSNIKSVRALIQPQSSKVSKRQNQ